jgi:hypothetical protein
MIHIDFKPENLTGAQKEWWDNWTRKSAEMIGEIIKKWSNDEEYTFDAKYSKHWGELKDFYLQNVFNGKCGYCESEMERGVFQAEHYRPKNKVTEEDPETKKQKTVKVKVNSDEIEHPGYFWLALNWKNLPPSCVKCNTSGGKGTKFPTAKEHVYILPAETVKESELTPEYFKVKKGSNEYYLLSPEDLNRLEDPNLIHPFFHNPDDYLVFGSKGTIAAKDNNPKGVDSIKTYNLNDEKLRIARQQAQESAIRLYGEYLEACLKQIENPVYKVIKDEDEKKLYDYKEGKAEYSAAVSSYLENVEESRQHIF